MDSQVIQQWAQKSIDDFVCLEECLQYEATGDVHMHTHTYMYIYTHTYKLTYIYLIICIKYNYNLIIYIQVLVYNIIYIIN